MNAPQRRFDHALRAGWLRALDARLATLLGECFPGAHPIALDSAAWVSRHLADGHVCLDLARVATTPWFGAPELDAAPAPGPWQQALQASGFVGVPGETQPLILDGTRLYLHRYWHYEASLASRLHALAGPAPGIDDTHLGDGLARLFPTNERHPDWQKVAAAVAVLRRFAVISGGPGTGKTHTVTAILALLLEQGLARGNAPRIQLAAPTGKAAARIAESLEKARQRLPLSDAVRAALPTEATTLHRLLGVGPARTLPRHDRDNPLPLDVLVIDEASMIDLPLMAKTVAALPAHARLILLGDKDQLASVEAGNVLADICGDGGERPFSRDVAARLNALGLGVAVSDSAQPALADSVVLLRHSYRFAAGGEIARLARAVNAVDRATLQDAWEAPRDGVRVIDPGDRTHLIAEMAEGYRAVFAAADAEAAFTALNEFRVLTALRAGPDGVTRLNSDIERALRRAHRLQPEPGSPWYRGRPIMITRNAPDLRLANGDIGLCWPSPDTPDRLRVAFPGADGQLRWFSTQRLPEHETVYAMTVHKSQGSEFGDVLLLLSAQANPVTTRELVYTGITRARERLTLATTRGALNAAIATRTLRGSGLAARCWSEPEPTLAGLSATPQ